MCVLVMLLHNYGSDKTQSPSFHRNCENYGQIRNFLSFSRNLNSLRNNKMSRRMRVAYTMRTHEILTFVV